MKYISQTDKCAIENVGRTIRAVTDTAEWSALHPALRGTLTQWASEGWEQVLQDNMVFRRLDQAIIVSRHAGAIEWLRRRGFTGDVLEHVTEDDVRDKVVVGALPLHLAALARRVVSIDMPGLTPDQRGKDLTPDEMDAAGARLRWYAVQIAEG